MPHDHNPEIVSSGSAVARDSARRRFDGRAFHRAFEELVVGGRFQEPSDYYPRYRNRYRKVLSAYAALAEGEPLDVLEVGGGQHALLAAELWGDRAAVADLDGPHLDYLQGRGVRTFRWNLMSEEEPFRAAFDRVFLCEVMAHVPAPPHTYLVRLRRALRAGGKIIVTTPNLYRLRNVASMIFGRKVFDPFALPEAGRWGGGFLDFSREHLHWQLEAAGFRDVHVAYREFGHTPHALGMRMLHWTLCHLRLVPRFRYHLFAVATTP